jgi:hypothetical protein
MASRKRPVKHSKRPRNIEETYSHVFAFFNGAFAANSGGCAKEMDFENITVKQMEQAEEELSNLCNGLDRAYMLGMWADEGYTMWGQTRQNLDDGDDEQHKLLAFTLLEELY